MAEGQGTTGDPFRLGAEITQAAGVKALEGLTLGSADLAAFISPGVESAVRMTTGIDPMEALQNQALAQDLTKLTGVKVSDFADRLRDITATSIGFGLMGGSVGGIPGAAVGATAGALAGAIGRENIRKGFETLLPENYAESLPQQIAGGAGYLIGGFGNPAGLTGKLIEGAKTLGGAAARSAAVGGGIGAIGSLPQVEQGDYGGAALTTAASTAIGAAAAPVAIGLGKIGAKANNLLKQAQTNVNDLLNRVSEIQRQSTFKELRSVQQFRDNAATAQRNAQQMQMQAMRAAEQMRARQAADYQRVQRGLIKTQQEAQRVVQLAESNVAEDVIDNLLAAQKGLTSKALEGDFREISEAQARQAQEIPREMFDDLNATLEEKRALQEASNDIQVKLLSTEARETILKDFDMPSFVRYVDKLVSDDFAVEAARMQELRAVRENAGNYFKEAAQRLNIDNTVKAYQSKLEQIKRIDDYFTAKAQLDETPTPKESRINEEVKAFESELSDLEAVKARLKQAYKNNDAGELNKIIQENADIIDDMRAVHGDDLAGLEDDAILAIGLEDEIDAVKSLVKDKKQSAESELMDIKRQKLKQFRKRYGTDDETEGLLQAERARIQEQADLDRAEYLRTIQEAAEISKQAAERQMRMTLKRVEQTPIVSIVDRGLPTPKTTTKTTKAKKVAKNADTEIKIETGGTKTEDVKEVVVEGIAYKSDGETLTVETPTDEMVKFTEQLTDTHNTAFDEVFKVIADWTAPAPMSVEETGFKALNEFGRSGETPTAPKVEPKLKRGKTRITVDFGDEGKIVIPKAEGYKTTSDERLIEIAQERMDKRRAEQAPSGTPSMPRSLAEKAQAVQGTKGKGVVSRGIDDLIVPIISRIQESKFIPDQLKRAFSSKLNTLRAARHGFSLELSNFTAYVNRAANTRFKNFGELAKYLNKEATNSLDYPTETYQEILKENNPEAYRIGAAIKEYFMKKAEHGVKGQQTLGELMQMEFKPEQEVYFPRMVKDINELRARMESESLLAGMKPAERNLKEELARELEGGDYVLEEDLVTNNFMERKFKYIPEKYRDVYMSSGDALAAKIGDFQKQKAEYDFFDGSLDRGAGMSNKLNDLIKTKAAEAGVELNDAGVAELNRTLHPVFDKLASNDPFVIASKAISSFTMARLLSGFKSALTQAISTPRLATAYFGKLQGLQDFFVTMAYLPPQLRKGFVEAVKGTDILNDLMYMDKASGMLKFLDKFTKIATFPMRKATQIFESPMALGTSFKAFYRESQRYLAGKARPEFVSFAEMEFGDDAERLIRKFGERKFDSIPYDEDVALVAFTMAARKANMVYGKMDLPVASARQVRTAGDFIAQNVARLNSYVSLNLDTLKRGVVGEMQQGRPVVAFKNAITTLAADIAEMHLRLITIAGGAMAIGGMAGLSEEKVNQLREMARSNVKGQTAFDSYIGKRFPVVGGLMRYSPNLVDFPALMQGDVEGFLMSPEEENSQITNQIIGLLFDTFILKGGTSELRTVGDTFTAARQGLAGSGSGLLNVLDPVANPSSRNIPVKWMGDIVGDIVEPGIRGQSSKAVQTIVDKYVKENITKKDPEKAYEQMERTLNTAASAGIDEKEIVYRNFQGTKIPSKLSKIGRYQAGLVEKVSNKDRPQNFGKTGGFF
jgi:hypothetical protein